MTGRLDELLEQHWRLSTSGDYARSDALLREILDEFPSEPQVLMRWGMARADVAPEEAKSYLIRAAELAPEDPYVQVSAGGALHGLGAVDEAFACGARATLRIADDFHFAPQLANLLGRIAVSQGRLPEARAALQWAFDAEPEFPYLARDLARFLLRHDGREAALEVLRQLPDDLPDDDPAWELRAELERQAGDDR